MFQDVLIDSPARDDIILYLHCLVAAARCCCDWTTVSGKADKKVIIE
jgi:hypothetical protein